MWKGRVSRGIFTWLQLTTSPPDVSQSYNTNIKQDYKKKCHFGISMETRGA